MPKQLTWDDPEDLGILLSEKHPEIDPLAVRFTDLHRLVAELPEFKDDPKKSSEGKLEAIQMAWHEEYEDAL
jgi:FeS assembly protein IscX